MAAGGLALAAASAVTLSAANDPPPRPRVEVAEGFPAVLPPSFEGPFPSPAASGSAAAASSPRRPVRPAGPRATGAVGTTSGEPISGYSACSGRGTVTFTATYARPFGYRHVFIDRDTKASTGYRIPDIAGGFGADFMIENDVLYESTGPDWAWQAVVGVSPRQSTSGGAYRWQLRTAHGLGRAVFNASDGETTEERYTPVVKVKAC